MSKVKLLVSPELQAIVGKKEASRVEVINLVRVYLNGRKMKYEDKKVYFVPDKKMAKVFGSSKFRNCSIGDYIDAHLSPIIAKNDSDYGPHLKNQDEMKGTDDLDDNADDSFETTDDLHVPVDDSNAEVTFNSKKQKLMKGDDNSIDDFNNVAVDGPNLSSTNTKNDSDDSSHIEPQESDDFTDLGIIYVNESNALDIELQKLITYFNSDDALQKEYDDSVEAADDLDDAADDLNEAADDLDDASNDLDDAADDLNEAADDLDDATDDLDDAADDLNEAADDLDDDTDDLDDAADDLHVAADDLDNEVTFNIINQDDDEITFNFLIQQQRNDDSYETRLPHDEIQELVFDHFFINLPEHLMLPQSWPGWMHPEERQDGYLNLDNAARADGSYP